MIDKEIEKLVEACFKHGTAINPSYIEWTAKMEKGKAAIANLKKAILKEIEKAYKAGLDEGHGIIPMDGMYKEELWQQYKKDNLK